MECIRCIEDLKSLKGRSGIALGTFDGLHIGHQTVIKNMILACQRQNLCSSVLTFQNHPKEITTNKEAPPKILSIQDKVNLLESYGVERLILLPFDKKLMSMSAQTFIEDILVRSLKAKHIAVGFDFRFGHRAQGSVTTLKAYKKQGDYTLNIVEPVTQRGQKVSSSTIRNLLKNGRIEEVTKQLGRHHFVTGEVVKGKQLGNQLGFPTANLRMSENMSLIRPGVYATKTTICQMEYYSVSNVGYNPTFQEPFQIETHILGFDQNIYGQTISVAFHKRIRDEKKMESLEQLSCAIGNDVSLSKMYFGIKV